MLVIKCDAYKIEGRIRKGIKLSGITITVLVYIIYIRSEDWEVLASLVSSKQDITEDVQASKSCELYVNMVFNGKAVSLCSNSVSLIHDLLKV